MGYFNLRRYKEARRGSEPPEAFLPQVWRGDPYDRTRHPGDGQGYKLTTPGSQGVHGEPGDISSPEFGRRWTSEGPDIPTGFIDDDASDKATHNNETPAGGDPDSPFGADDSGDNRSTQYGTGLSTDFGQMLHDDPDPAADNALGRHSTVERMMSGEDRDRKTPYGDMRQQSHPFNASRRKNLFDRIRKNQ